MQCDCIVVFYDDSSREANMSRQLNIEGEAKGVTGKNGVADALPGVCRPGAPDASDRPAELASGSGKKI
jgi:hypothetical protein